MPFRLPADPCVILHTWQSRQWDTVVSSTCSKRVIIRRARPPTCACTSSSHSSCRDIHDVLRSRAPRWMATLAHLPGYPSSRRPSSQLDQKERNTETSDLLNRPAPPSCNDKPASMESLVFWVQTVANSAKVNDCCSDVCSSASFSSDVDSDAACNGVEHECPSSTL